MYYAGIGARKIPEDIRQKMYGFAAQLARAGWTLRSGGADGSDAAFEAGCDSELGKKEIFLPWKGFNKSLSSLYKVSPEAEESVEKYHPAPQNLSLAAKRLMGRNYHQVMGPRIGAHSSGVCICYTEGGKLVGGTSQALRIILDLLPNCVILNLGAYAFEMRHIHALIVAYQRAVCRNGIFFFHSESPADGPLLFRQQST